ncbi:MAG: DUF1622 domain-containing protein [Solirubrobacteraceae bacterium]|nr:DUF1622 domain-containing protein [Solirubrobacteraceae bacterium]
MGVDFAQVAESVADAIDGAGIAVIVFGLLLATALLARDVRRGAPELVFGYRRNVGKAILVGLEFLVAADIIRTIAVSPSFRGVGVLALIVLVRTFLSFTLELEVNGRWPWQQAPAADQPPQASAKAAAL